MCNKIPIQKSTGLSGASMRFPIMCVKSKLWHICHAPLKAINMGEMLISDERYAFSQRTCHLYKYCQQIFATLTIILCQLSILCNHDRFAEPRNSMQRVEKLPGLRLHNELTSINNVSLQRKFDRKRSMVF